MKAKSRFQEARIYLAAGTIATLLGVWSALTVHDIQARNASQTAATNTSNVVNSSQNQPNTTSNYYEQPSYQQPSYTQPYQAPTYQQQPTYQQPSTIVIPRTRTRAS